MKVTLKLSRFSTDFFISCVSFVRFHSVPSTQYIEECDLYYMRYVFWIFISLSNKLTRPLCLLLPSAMASFTIDAFVDEDIPHKFSNGDFKITFSQTFAKVCVYNILFLIGLVMLCQTWFRFEILFHLTGFIYLCFVMLCQTLSGIDILKWWLFPIGHVMLCQTWFSYEIPSQCHNICTVNSIFCLLH